MIYIMLACIFYSGLKFDGPVLIFKNVLLSAQQPSEERGRQAALKWLTYTVDYGVISEFRVVVVVLCRNRVQNQFTSFWHL